MKVVDEQSLRKKASAGMNDRSGVVASRVSAAESMDNVNLEDSSTAAAGATSPSSAAAAGGQPVRGRTFRE